MVELISNRWFYKCSDDFIDHYKAKVKNHIKVNTRLNPDILNSIELFKQLFPNCKMEKRNKVDDKEFVKKFKWNLTPFDNTNYGDEYNFISTIIIQEENINEFFDIIKNNFNYTKKKNNKYCYTLKIDPSITTRGIWKNKIIHPHLHHNSLETFYPICIVSFGRYNEYGRTHILLTKLKIKHYLFVEPFEYELYKEWYNPYCCQLRKSDENFHLRNMGSTPMRNYILDQFEYCSRIWLLDDNIKCYKRLYDGVKNDIEDIEIFTSIEKYICNYDNVGIVSHNFNPDVREGGCRPIIIKNGKCYSSMLIPTDEEFRFKHKHQEDNFISIESICKGYTNLCFNHILYDKNTSGQDGGGNTKFIYKKDENDIGRKDRYDYSFETTKKLIESGDIILKKDKTIDSFIFHKPLKHEYYHVNFNYKMLENNSKNDIKLKPKKELQKIEYEYTLYLDTN
jgi:hypothetical protein